jgi:hypothetical protein
MKNRARLQRSSESPVTAGQIWRAIAHTVAGFRRFGNRSTVISSVLVRADAFCWTAKKGEKLVRFERGYATARLACGYRPEKAGLQMVRR